MRYTVAVLIALSSLTCVYGVEIEILVINSRTAKPKSDFPLEVKVVDRGGRLRKVFARDFAIRSNAAGTARVNIDAVAYPFLSVGGVCSPPNDVRTQEILDTGVIAPNYCWHKNKALASLKPRPGQLIIFFDQPSFWWNLRHAP